MHGDFSAGPRTAEGIARLVAARPKHGEFSSGMVALRREFDASAKPVRSLVNALTSDH